MPGNLIRRLLLLGALAIIGIISIQSYWLLKTWDLKDKEFDQTVRIMLRHVADDIAKFHKTELPKTQLIQRQSSNYYAVNVNSPINASVLEDYLYQEMDNHGLNTNFEYAVYDCFTKDLVYGNYCEMGEQTENHIKSEVLPTLDNLEYYFVVRFPSRESFLLSNMNMTLAFAAIAIVSVLFFMYSIWVIVKQKRLSELQRDFINNMTHEFKTPISSIKIAADVLSKDPTINKDPRLSNYSKIIIDQNQRLNNQVEKVLNIARLEKDNLKLKKEKFDLTAELRSIAENEKIKLKGGQLTYDIPDEPIEIDADKLHFTNVITNIIDNAVKYSSEEPKVHLSLNQKSGKVRITISDNGIGIPKEQTKEVFDKFYRVSTGDVHDVKGFGLGLFYVKNISQAHGWIPKLESELSKGTTFTLDILV